MIYYYYSMRRSSSFERALSKSQNSVCSGGDKNLYSWSSRRSLFSHIAKINKSPTIKLNINKRPLTSQFLF